MENQVTMTFDPTNSLAAMAFVVADQQRVIKELQGELAQCRVKYDELDKESQKLQNKYDEDVADLCRKVDSLSNDIAERDAQVRCQVDEIRRLDEENSDLLSRIDDVSAWRPCRVEYDKNGNKRLVDFDKDGVVLVRFCVKNGEFWDCFNLQRKEGEVAYIGMEVKNGVSEQDLFMMDLDKEIRYISLSGFVNYENNAI